MRYQSQYQLDRRLDQIVASYSNPASRPPTLRNMGFVGETVHDCVFRYIDFSLSIWVNCTFSNCRFNDKCVFEETLFSGCKFVNCVGAPIAETKGAIFA